MKILIIEDDANLGLTLKTELESNSFQVDHFIDGVNGSFVARTKEYDLIILDYILPGKNALKIINDIRVLNINTPILVMSAYIEQRDGAMFLAQGANDYISKPFTFNELVSRIYSLTRYYNKDLPFLLQDSPRNSLSTYILTNTANYLTDGTIQNQ